MRAIALRAWSTVPIALPIFVQLVLMKTKGVQIAMTKKRTNRAKRLPTAILPNDRVAPTLRFSPTAWAKLLYIRDYGETEVGVFGISAADDLLLVEELRLVQQDTTFSHVAFDDTSVADLESICNSGLKRLTTVTCSCWLTISVCLAS